MKYSRYSYVVFADVMSAAELGNEARQRKEKLSRLRAEREMRGKSEQEKAEMKLKQVYMGTRSVTHMQLLGTDACKLLSPRCMMVPSGRA